MDVICHRACPAGGPENSVLAARSVPDWIDMIEVDVQRCASGELVVFHDWVLDRVTERTGTIAGKAWADLTKTNLEGTEATIPRLQTLIDAVPPEIGLNVELKHAGMAADLRPIIADLEHDVLISSFVPQAIAPFTGEDSHTALLIEPNRGTDWESDVAAAESLDAVAIHPQYDAVTPDRVAMAHDRGLRVNAWTVPDAETVERLREAGVDGVFVDDWQIAESLSRPPRPTR